MFPALFLLSDLNGQNGFVLNGIAPAEQSGFSVSVAGDLNGDRLADLVIGAPFANGNGLSNSGRSYLVFGSRGRFQPSLNLFTLNGANGLRLDGLSSREHLGWSVGGAGDVNGDRVDDLILGAPGGKARGRRVGHSYVVFGRRNGFNSQFSLARLDGRNGFVIEGDTVNAQLGRSVSGAGDVNGDGIDDVLVEAPSPLNRTGKVYVIFGSRSGFISPFDLSTLNGRNGFVIQGIPTTTNNISAILATIGGRTVSRAGDLNGDRVGDLIIGAPAANGSGRLSGQSYVIFGQRSGFAPTLEIATLRGRNGFILNGIAQLDLAGFAVSHAGDLNQDGLADVIIGAPFSNVVGLGSGQSYVMLGRAGGFSRLVDLASFHGSNGVAFNGLTGQSGYAVSAAGDVNGDRLDDVIIGAPFARPSDRPDVGQSYVIFGQRRGFEATFNLSSLDGSNGFKINGHAVGDQVGMAVGGGGDINGDGLDDLLIGAPFVNANGLIRAGQSYVVFGQKPKANPPVPAAPPAAPSTPKSPAPSTPKPPAPSSTLQRQFWKEIPFLQRLAFSPTWLKTYLTRQLPMFWRDQSAQVR